MLIGPAKMAQERSFYQQVAGLHYQGIDQGFLSSLGPEFLTLLYETIDKSPDAVLITEQHDGRVIGFVSGASRLWPIYKGMVVRLPRLVIALAPVLLSPLKLWRLLELLRHSVAGAKSEKNRSGVAIPDFELLSIAVAPEARRNGVAKRLYDALVVYVGSQRKHGFKIVVGETLIGAHKFYLRMGAVPQARACVHADTVSVVYVQKIA